MSGIINNSKIKSKKVPSSNCNGIPMADDQRTRKKLLNATTMSYPVPEPGMYVVVNVGVKGKTSLGSMHGISANPVNARRYAGIVKSVIGSLVFIEAFCPCMEENVYYADKVQEYEGVKYRLAVYSEQVNSFKSGYAQFVQTYAPYLKHIQIFSGGVPKSLYLPRFAEHNW